MKTRAEVQKAYRERRLRENPELVRALERERWRRRCTAMRIASAKQHSDENKRLLHLVDERTYNRIHQQTYRKRYADDQPKINDALDQRIKQYINCDVRALNKSATGRKRAKAAKKMSKKRTVVVNWEPLYSE